MRIELLVVPECPHHDAAVDVLAAALAELGVGEYSVVSIKSQADADEHGFVGSPTFQVNGVDLFPVQDPSSAIACRIYPGRAGVPGLAELTQALKNAAAATSSAGL